MRSIDRGFVPANLLTIELPLNDLRLQTSAPVDAPVHDVERRIQTVAGSGALAAIYSLRLEPTVAIPFTLLGRGRKRRDFVR